MTGSDLVSIYEFSYGAIKRNLEGVSNEESLVRPQPFGNCMNWVLGHIVGARGLVLTLAGAGSPDENDVVQRYKRGSGPISSADKPVDLGTLRGMLDDSQQHLIPALAALSEEALTAAVPEQFRRPPITGSVGEALARLNSHESYHNGQLGLLRRVVGKEGAIK